MYVCECESVCLSEMLKSIELEGHEREMTELSLRDGQNRIK